MIRKTKRSVGKIGSKNQINYAGVHLIAEFWGSRIIENPNKIEKILREAAKRGGNAPLKVTIHKFLPQGMTGVILLAESHIALHSWPEFNYLAVDIFTCGKKSFPHEALGYLKESFKPKRVETKVIKRGKLR